MRFRSTDPGHSRAVRLALALACFCPAFAGAQEPLSLHAYRFWRPPDNTLVEAYARIPLGLLSFERAGEQDVAAYSAAFEVVDAQGLTLTRQAWEDTVAVPAMGSSRSRASTTEHLTFQVKPGRYGLRLEVTNPTTGQVWRTESQIEAYNQSPAMSDLVLGGDLVRLDPDSAQGASGAIVRGELAVLPNLEGVISMERPTLAIYSEVYRLGAENPDSASVWIDLSGVGREFSYRTNPQTRIYPAGIGSEAFALSLAGLPPGEYQLALTVDMGPDTLVAQHRLAMLPPGSGIIATSGVLPFPDASNEQLDSIFSAMKAIASPAEMDMWERLTSADAKRRYIARFWEARAGSSGMTASDLMEDFSQRMQYASVQFRPSSRRTDRAGWETDRGRIYIKYGPPAERYTSGQTDSQEVKACEAWQYTGGRGDRYIFWDRSGFGDFELVFSTDREEPGLPNMQNQFSATGPLTCEPTGR